MSVKARTLKRPEWMKLFAWAAAHKAELATMTANEAAEAATKAIGFEVTYWNIRSICKDAEITLSRKRPRHRTHVPGAQNKRVAFLAAQLLALARIVEELHVTLGTQFPDGRINVEVLRQMRIGCMQSVQAENGSPQ